MLGLGGLISGLGIEGLQLGGSILGTKVRRCTGRVCFVLERGGRIRLLRFMSLCDWEEGLGVLRVRGWGAARVWQGLSVENLGDIKVF